MSASCRMNLMLVVCRVTDIDRFAGLGTFIEMQDIFGSTRTLLVHKTTDLVRMAERNTKRNCVPFYGADAAVENGYLTRFYADIDGYHHWPCNDEGELIVAVDEETGRPAPDDATLVQKFVFGENAVREIVHR